MVELSEVSLYPPPVEMATLMAKNSAQKEEMHYMIGGLVLLVVISMYTVRQYNILRAEYAKNTNNEPTISQ